MFQKTYLGSRARAPRSGGLSRLRRFLAGAPRGDAGPGCYLPRVRQLLPALALTLTGCLSPNPSFDEEAPTDAVLTSADDDADLERPGLGTSTGAPSATTSVGTSDGLTDATTGLMPGATSTSTSSTDAASTTSAAGTTGDDTATAPEETSGGGDDPRCPDDPRLALCFEFDDAADALVPDGSGSGNDGLATELALTDGPWGQALDAGETSKLKVEDSESLDLIAGVTIELQVALAELPDEGRVGLLDNDGQYGLFVRDSGALDCRASGKQLSGGALAVELWTHVACTADEDAMRLYIDGELVAEGDGSTLNTESDAPIAVGNSSPSWDEPTIGALDRVRVWSEALTPDKLCALAGPDACER